MSSDNYTIRDYFVRRVKIPQEGITKTGTGTLIEVGYPVPVNTVRIPTNSKSRISKERTLRTSQSILQTNVTTSLTHLFLSGTLMYLS